jgi:hypothetical protein
LGGREAWSCGRGHDNGGVVGVGILGLCCESCEYKNFNKNTGLI